MLRHCEEKHESNEQEFICKIRQMFGEDATLIQVTEAIDIRKEGSINNKMEWGACGPSKVGHRRTGFIRKKKSGI